MSVLLLALFAAMPDAGSAPSLGSLYEAESGSKTESDKKICKRLPVIGTLAGYKRECRTKDEWQQLANRTRDDFKDLQGTKGSSNGAEPGTKVSPN